MPSNSSWAERQGIRVGKLGDRVDGSWGYPADLGGYERHPIHICEANRATTYEFRKSGIELLQKILQDNYLSKGVDAVLYGIAGPEPKYAVFVESGWMREVEPD